MTPNGKRARVRIHAADEKRLLRALDRWAADGDFVALRTRAFVLLLWDGPIRTRAALALNAEEVVEDPRARRITVRKNIVQRSCEANRYRERSFFISARVQSALADYLRAVRDGNWLPSGRLQGPLFLSSTQRGQRLSARSAIHSFEVFQQITAPGCSQEYQLDDVVYTGRLAYVAAAGGDSESLSDHSGISRRWAAEYRSDHKLSPEEVIAKLDKQR